LEVMAAPGDDMLDSKAMGEEYEEIREQVREE
jgi:predicted esterase YcpF (UPF0227 family)